MVRKTPVFKNVEVTLCKSTMMIGAEKFENVYQKESQAEGGWNPIRIQKKSLNARQKAPCPTRNRDSCRPAGGKGFPSREDLQGIVWTPQWGEKWFLRPKLYQNAYTVLSLGVRTWPLFIC